MLRRLIHQEHEYHMARLHERGVKLGRNRNEHKTAKALAEHSLVEIKDDRVYLGRADDEY